MLHVFIDALPYTLIDSEYKCWLPNMKYSALIPNVGYSSSLHWQLFCNKYPDERGIFLDWQKKTENNIAVKLLSTVLTPLDRIYSLGVFIRKIMDRIIFRKNLFANIPFKFRKLFSNQSVYLFSSEDIYGKENIFYDYTVISQDENCKTFKDVIELMKLNLHKKNLFVVFNFADEIGHKFARGKEYNQNISEKMEILKDVILQYMQLYPNEKVLISSDHGMSTVKKKINIRFPKEFGKQSKSTYLVYTDSALMCIFISKNELKPKLENYLKKYSNLGHILTDKEREYYGITNTNFGDIIFNLKEGVIFDDNWFGKHLRKKHNLTEQGMHGFWPDINARDQFGVLISVNCDNHEDKIYTYKEAYNFIYNSMRG